MKVLVELLLSSIHINVVVRKRYVFQNVLVVVIPKLGSQTFTSQEHTKVILETIEGCERPVTHKNYIDGSPDFLERLPVKLLDY